MTDEQNGLGDVAQVAQENNEQAQQPKMLSQDEVNRLIGAKKAEAFEKGRKAAMAEIGGMPFQQNSASQAQLGGMPSKPMLSDSQVKDILDQLRNEQINAQHEMAAKKTVDDFYGRVKSAEAQYPNLVERLNSINIAAFPEIVQMATFHDNTAAIMDELEKNPHKLIELKQFSQLSPQLALREMTKLSNSIKENQEALSNKKEPVEPFNQLNHSAKGAKASGDFSLSDFKKMFRE